MNNVQERDRGEISVSFLYFFNQNFVYEFWANRVQLSSNKFYFSFSDELY